MQRRRAPPDRPVRRRVHPGHPLGAPRLRHRVPHAAGHDPAHRRLQARPHAGRRPAHRPRPHRRDREGPTASGCCCPTPPTPTSTGHAAQRDVGRQGAVRPVPRARGPAHRHRLLRQPHPPRAADRRRRDRVRPHDRHARHVDEEERAAGPRDGPAAHPRQPARRHRGRRRPRPGQGVRDLDRVAGRADVGARADGGEREPLAQDRARGHGDPQLAPDPGQRDERVEGDRRPDAPRRRGRALRHRRRARHRPRQAGGAQDAPVDRAARVVHAGARRVPPPRRATPGSRRPMGVRRRARARLRGRRPAPARPTTA